MSTTTPTKIKQTDDVLRRNVAFMSAVVRNAWALKIWKDKMESSMKSYVRKVKASINNISREALKIIITSQISNNAKLLMHVANEVNESYSWLDTHVAKMNSLIRRVCECASDNTHLKTRVMSLLQVMRRPRLPNITILTQTIKARPSLARRSFRR